LEPTTKKAYALAGVDIHLADKVKKIIAQQARTTFSSGVLSRLADLFLRGNPTQCVFMKIQILCGI